LDEFTTAACAMAGAGAAVALLKTVDDGQTSGTACIAWAMRGDTMGTAVEAAQ
jgi:hypothetical protein